MNEQLHKTREILHAAQYRCLRGEFLTQENGVTLFFQWWAGPKGIVLLTYEDGEPGVTSYADWPLGHTYDELEEALK